MWGCIKSHQQLAARLYFDRREVYSGWGCQAPLIVPTRSYSWAGTGAFRAPPITIDAEVAEQLDALGYAR